MSQPTNDPSIKLEFASDPESEIGPAWMSMHSYLRSKCEARSTHVATQPSRSGWSRFVGMVQYSLSTAIGISPTHTQPMGVREMEQR